MYRISVQGFEQLLETLQAEKYVVVGPTPRDGAIVYDEIHQASDLPIGLTDAQTNGKYELQKRQDQAYFGYNVGPHSWKKYLFPPELKLFEAKREGTQFVVKSMDPPKTKYAFLGVRACELAAIKIQDKIFMSNPFSDSYYSALRKKSFIIAVNCTQAGGTCFCVSMDTGPRAKEDFDLSLTEIIQGKSHYFLVEVGSAKGEKIIKKIPSEKATENDLKTADNAIQNAARQMGKSLDTTDIKELFQNNLESPLWDEIAERCLACGNCTFVCPTCFCHTVEDVTDLDGEHAIRNRRWDSCFNLDFTYIHGGSIRVNTASRYRQWITHKLANWYDQFGTSGCVGCGRCITWCPVGIDITEEARRLREMQIIQNK